MKIVKKNVWLYLVITVSLLLILLLCDGMFLNSSVTGDISKNVLEWFQNSVGVLSLPILFTIVLFAVVYLFPSEKIPRHYWLAGVSLFLAAVPPLLEFLKVKTSAVGDTHPGGNYGAAVNSIIEKTGSFAYFIYAIIVFLSFFVFLFPYRYLLSGFVVSIFTGEKTSEPNTKQTRTVHKSQNGTFYRDYNIPKNDEPMERNQDRKSDKNDRKYIHW